MHAYRFVHRAYDRLVNNGKLKENIRKIGCCNIIMAIFKYQRNMRLNYNDITASQRMGNTRRQDEDLTLELFQETFRTQVPGAHTFP